MAKVRVLITLTGDSEAKKVSLEAAAAGIRAADFAARFAPASNLPGVEIDSSFAPVPLEAMGRTPILAMSTAENAATHVVRGEVDSRTLDAVAELPNARIFADPQIEAIAVEGCGPSPIGAVADVHRLLNTAGLASRGLDGRAVAVAICDTGINEAHLLGKGLKPNIASQFLWTPPGVPATPGNYPLDHATMCAHAVMIAAPKATLIDIPLLQSTTPGQSAMSGVLSDAVAAFAYLRQLLAAKKVRRLVVNNSWGMYKLAWDFPAGHPGRYADNPQHPFNLACSALARAGADILFAAGNCGPSCADGRCGVGDPYTITGANAHPDVTTVAGVSIRGRLIGYSSQGPGIPGMAAQKPDIACYTHYLGSEAFGVGVPDSGTSTACPVTAGSVAALRTSQLSANFRPADLARELRTDALSSAQPTRWNKRLGYGILNPYDTAVRLNL